jgi:uncharacterized membrane protein
MSRPRIASLDVVRGLIMVLMAIDHVRVYSGQPAGGPTPGIFFTRWITHFVAPGFLFFAGTGAFLHGAKLGDRAKLARFLVSRGIWLVLLELTFLRFAWTFNFDYAHYSLAGVIWMIGWCMVLMGAVVFLPMWAIGLFGALTMLCHPLLNLLGGAAQHSALAWLWQILYFGGGFSIGKDGPPLLILFVIVPWIGVMAAGYAFGPVMRWPAEQRRRFCLTLGVAMTLAFVVLRALDLPGDPRSWHKMAANGFPAALAFLNTSKYPASPLFLLMTLGPLILLLPLVEGAKGAWTRILETFGRVPLFYYVLHIPLIHLSALIVSYLRIGSVSPWLFMNHPLNPGPVPANYVWSLPLLYLDWAIVVAILYLPCRWYARLKADKRSTLLSYL